jgi:hypothetical protein
MKESEFFYPSILNIQGDLYKVSLRCKDQFYKIITDCFAFESSKKNLAAIFYLDKNLFQ